MIPRSADGCGKFPDSFQDREPSKIHREDKHSHVRLSGLSPGKRCTAAGEIVDWVTSTLWDLTIGVCLATEEDDMFRVVNS
jgi:hypothetical protein